MSHTYTYEGKSGKNYKHHVTVFNFVFYDMKMICVKLTYNVHVFIDNTQCI